MATRNAFAVSMRIEKRDTQRGMSAGRELGSGVYSVHQEPQGVSIIIEPQDVTHRGYTKMRLTRQQAEVLVADIKTALDAA